MLSATSRSKISAVQTGSKSAAARGKNDKSAAVEVETPKQILRHLMKLYEQHCVADDSLALSSVKRTIRTGIQLKSLPARVNFWTSNFFSIPLFFTRPPDIVVGGLRFYRNSSSIFYLLFSSATLRARWTELNRNQPHARKWVQFENACSKSGVYPPPKNWGPKPPFFDDFAT